MEDAEKLIKNYTEYMTLSTLPENVIRQCSSSEIGIIPDPFFGSTFVKHLGIDDTNFDNALAAVRTAMSYWNAKNSGDVTFDYQDGAGPLKLADSDGIVAPVTNAEGKAVIDCSGFIGFVMRGIDYLSSVYADIKGADLSCNPQDIGCTNAQKCSDEPRSGDLCFFYKTNDDGTIHYPNRFMGISHVGIMINPEMYLNATATSSNKEGVIVTRKSVREPFMYARPLYGCMEDGVKKSITNDKDNLLPGIWADILQGESEAGGNISPMI